MKKISFTIEYAGLHLQVARNEQGQDVVPLKPICDLFGLKWESQRRKVTESDYYTRFYGICTPSSGGSDGQNREQTCLLLAKVAAFLMSLSPEMIRVKGNVAGADFLEQKQQEWADALHDYEELGVAVNLNHARAQELLSKQRSALARMLMVKSRTSELEDRRLAAQVLKQMADEQGLFYQLDLLDDRQES